MVLALVLCALFAGFVSPTIASAQIQLLMPMDDSNFNDTSPSPATVNKNPEVLATLLETTVVKFGAGALNSTGTNSSRVLTVTDDGRFGVTTQNWTERCGWRGGVPTSRVPHSFIAAF
jgi:hypothetical protein